MAEPVNVNPTPRQIFRADPNRLSKHRDLMQQPVLNLAIDVALAQYTRTLTEHDTAEGNVAAQNFYKLAGVHKFIDTLRKLAEMPALPDKTESNNKLNYNL